MGTIRARCLIFASILLLGGGCASDREERLSIPSKQPTSQGAAWEEDDWNPPAYLVLDGTDCVQEHDDGGYTFTEPCSDLGETQVRVDGRPFRVRLVPSTSGEVGFVDLRFFMGKTEAPTLPPLRVPTGIDNSGSWASYAVSTGGNGNAYVRVSTNDGNASRFQYYRFRWGSEAWKPFNPRTLIHAAFPDLSVGPEFAFEVGNATAYVRMTEGEDACIRKNAVQGQPVRKMFVLDGEKEEVVSWRNIPCLDEQPADVLTPSV